MNASLNGISEGPPDGKIKFYHYISVVLDLGMASNNKM